MKRFRKILVWFEESDAGQQALSQAAAVARESGASLTIAHCIEPAPRLLDAIYARAQELRLALRREWETNLAGLASALEAEGVSATTKLLEGRPFLEFAREVIESEHDLLVKPADEATATQGVRLGSGDMHVLRKVPCAVWITGADEPNEDAVLTLVDPNPEDQTLNERLLQVGADLASRRGADLHVASIWEATGVTLLTKHVAQEEVDAYTKDAQARATNELTSLLTDCDVELPPGRVHLRRGAVADVVPRLVEELGVGLVVLGSVSRTGIRGLLMGNTAETILARVDRPVLTVKPAHFVSPVTLGPS